MSKRDARARALEFAAPFVDLLDLDRHVVTHMVPARDCRRISHVTVSCWFSATLVAENRTVAGEVRVHRQRDGLLGCLLPWDPADVWVPVPSGEPAGG